MFPQVEMSEILLSQNVTNDKCSNCRESKTVTASLFTRYSSECHSFMSPWTRFRVSFIWDPETHYALLRIQAHTTQLRFVGSFCKIQDDSQMSPWTRFRVSIIGVAETHYALLRIQAHTTQLRFVGSFCKVRDNNMFNF